MRITHRATPADLILRSREAASRRMATTGLSTHLCVLATGFVRALHLYPPSGMMRVQGRPGGRMHPGPPRKKFARKRVDHRYSGDTPAFPAQRFTTYSVLSPVNQRLPPSPARCLWSFARAWRLQGRARTTRLRRPRPCRSSVSTLASAAFRPTFVTIAIRPLCRCGVGAVNHIFRKNERRIFLREGLDNPNQLDAASEFRFSRMSRPAPENEPVWCSLVPQELDPRIRIHREQDCPITSV
jgi:hypothetical protein